MPAPSTAYPTSPVHVEIGPDIWLDSRLAVWFVRPRLLVIPALVASSHRLILPAFSPWAAGTPWGSPATAGETIWAIAPSRIFALARNDSVQTGNGA
ncbi:MAG: hypothetical protein EXS37_01540 [Opitutus sp.]|nr:hypothetical protein [Opitutus sp.]